MNTQQIKNVLNALPARYPSDRTEGRAQMAISSTAEIIAPILAQRGWQITKGSTSPSASRTISRIYLEPVGNPSHDNRHGNCQTIRQWEWLTFTKYGSAPLTAKAIIELCKELQSELL